jgi:hypothetical protein
MKSYHGSNLQWFERDISDNLWSQEFESRTIRSSKNRFRSKGMRDSNDCFKSHFCYLKKVCSRQSMRQDGELGV